MKGRLLVVAVVAVLGLVAAGTAAADVTMSWSGGFIGRGDVIANGGKDMLVETAEVYLHEELLYAGTCVRSDGSRVPGTYLDYGSAYYLAHARNAPGNGMITGYTIGYPYEGLSSGYYTPSCSQSAFVDRTLVSHTIRLTFSTLTWEDAFTIVLLGG